MASFNISANNYLRNLYSANRNLVNSSERKNASIKDLGKADSKALSNGIDALKSYDFESDDKKKFYNNLKALADSYNNTLQTGSEISEGDTRTKSIVKDIKKLAKKYGDELERYGISFDKKGYMKVDAGAADNISPKSYKSVMGEDSEFLNELSKLSKKMSRSVNYLV